jgi:hypothetical protein
VSKRMVAAAILGGGVAALSGVVVLVARQEPQHIARFPDDDWATWTLADVADLTLAPDPYHAAITYPAIVEGGASERAEPRPNRPRAA